MIYAVNLVYILCGGMSIALYAKYAIHTLINFLAAIWLPHDQL